MKHEIGDVFYMPVNNGNGDGYYRQHRALTCYQDPGDYPWKDAVVCCFEVIAITSGPKKWYVIADVSNGELPPEGKPSLFLVGEEAEEQMFPTEGMCREFIKHMRTEKEPWFCYEEDEEEGK